MPSTLPNDLVNALNVVGLEPLRANSFAVEIAGEPLGRHIVGGFSEAEGLNQAGEVIQIKEGGYDGTHEFPGRDKVSPVTLRRPMTTSRYFWNWYVQAHNWEKGQASYARDVTIHHLEWRAGIAYEVWSWTLIGAWVADWRGPGYNALSSNLAVETVVLHHKGIVENRSLLGGAVGEVIGVIANT